VSDVEGAWQALRDHVGEIETLGSIGGMLDWDQQTMMPPRAAKLRGSQQALLARLAHERLADPRIAGWLAALEGSGEPVRRACVRNLRRKHERARRVTAELVERLAHARARGFAAWLEAKRSADFARFEPELGELLELSLRRAEAIDPERHPYEVVLETYDPGVEVGFLSELFARLRAGLEPLLAAIAARPQLPSLGGEFEPARQAALHREVAATLGYEFEGGRLDEAEHPFTSGHGPGDVRITTHYERHDLLSGLSGTIHETGHGLYEQGLPHEHDGTSVSRAASFGLHESQSRFWENFVGRSLAFCTWLAPRIEAHFPGAGIEAERLYQAGNRVERGLRRVAADEVTYNLHIILRFELELALFERKLAVADLPEAWNARHREILGVGPADDAEGVLQDVHWSSAAFGYFPSYTLGNLWAASLGRSLEEGVPDLWSQVERGEFSEVLGFLRERVHGKGHLLEAPEIMRAAVGERDAVADLLGHLWQRHGCLYGVEEAATR